LEYCSDITATGIDDTEFDGNQNYTIILSPVSSTDNSFNGIDLQDVSLTNFDNDIVNFSSASQSIFESTGAVMVTVKLDAINPLEIKVPYTVSGTATGSGIDYDLTAGDIVVPAGMLLNSVSFNVIDDMIEEPDETVIITIGTPTNVVAGAIAIQTVTILDNDTIWYIDGNSIISGDGTTWATAFKTIQEGIDAASVDDQIWIKKGTYVLSSTISLDRIDNCQWKIRIRWRWNFHLLLSDLDQLHLQRQFGF